MKDIKDKDLWEKHIASDSIPEIDLYMDQVLSLTAGKGITKAMINNYSKEHLIRPLKGKKYSKEQILQILFIMNLKQNIQLGDVKLLMPEGDQDPDCRKVYEYCEKMDERLSDAAASFISREIKTDDTLSERESSLAAALMISSCCRYFRNICEELARSYEDKSGDE